VADPLPHPTEAPLQEVLGRQRVQREQTEIHPQIRRCLRLRHLLYSLTLMMTSPRMWTQKSREILLRRLTTTTTRVRTSWVIILQSESCWYVPQSLIYVCKARVPRDEEEVFGLNDTYAGPDLDDEGEYEDLTVGQRRAAEAEMTRRDASGRRGKGSRTAARRRRLEFIEDDEDEEDEVENGVRGIVPTGVKLRTRKHYDERRDIDDAEGVDDDDDLPAEELAEIKANSLAEWIAMPRVRKTIGKQFRHFLVTYVDENGTSVYGERIKTLGESMFLLL
jgi:Mini-chromosome maintenance protein 2